MSHNAGSKVAKRDKAKKDADVVRLIKEAGAIPLLTSNTPEMCMNWVTENKVTGRTNNPYDTRRTCGGSSGGEVRKYLFLLINFVISINFIMLLSNTLHFL